MCRIVALVAALTAVLVRIGNALAFAKDDETVTVDDGVAPQAGKEVVVSGSGVPTAAGRRTYSVGTIDDATFSPRGSRLRATFGASTAGTAAGLLYLDLPMAAGSRVEIGPATLMLTVLTRPVSG